MRHTLWYSGILIGDAKLTRNASHPRQLVGEFRPTPFGREVLPQLTGALTAAADLKTEMAERGVSEETLSNAATGPDVIETLSAGRKMVDIGRHLSQVQLRDPNGTVLAWKTIAFLDLAELDALSRRLGTLRPLPPGAAPAAQARVLVSATLAPPDPFGDRAARLGLS